MDSLLERVIKGDMKLIEYQIRKMKSPQELVGKYVKMVESSTSIPIGLVGKVVHIKKHEKTFNMNLAVGVDWQENVDGHTCDGHCDENHGWYVPLHTIEIIE